MRIKFNIEYYTNIGEQLFLNFIDESAKQRRHAMSTYDGKLWFVEIPVVKKSAYVDYYYTVCVDGEEQRKEYVVVPHRLEFSALKSVQYHVYDQWIDIPEDAYLYTSAYTDCVVGRPRELSAPTEYARTLRLKVRAPQVGAGQHLALAGAPEYLGAWDCKRALPMAEHEYHEWVVSLDADRVPGQFEFKFVILNDDGTGLPSWENGENRMLDFHDVQRNEVVVMELAQPSFMTHPWKAAGIVVPVFSLRSEGSFGVGDFGDLKSMVDWCAKTRLRVLQILPINDTNITHTWQDSYPYNSISIYALHPQYMDIRQLPELEDRDLRGHYEKLRQELNALPQIDYERVFQTKMEYLNELFKQEGAKVKRNKDYKEFLLANKEWLEPYARFCFYRDHYGTATFSHWPSRLIKPNQKVLDFWYFVQFHLDAQMKRAHEYARMKKVILKGDIPIGISRDGVEAWVEPRYFNLNGQAGAPPDAFATDGQNWGFPTYNWDEMLKDGCAWWVRRFRKMAEYFDAYRIDHVLGFFRIWEIPVPEKSGLMGQFSPALGMSREEIEAYGIVGHDELFLVDHKRHDRWHPRIAVQFQDVYQRLNDGEKDAFNRLYNDYYYHRNNQFWYQEAMKKLPLLTQATRMLVCAEDLGMVPECVPWVMDQLRILTLEIQSMPKDPNLRFGKLSHNPYRSVCTISTHDMPTLRQWWDEDFERTQQYYNTSLRRAEQAPHPLPGWLAKEIVSRNLTSPSMLCLISLQDWLAINEKLRLPDQNGERINIPANPRHYWRYRMHLTIEQLMEAEELNAEIKELIINSGRK
jgi:4-alpha-glucanotransferase